MTPLKDWLYGYTVNMYYFIVSQLLLGHIACTLVVVLDKIHEPKLYSQALFLYWYCWKVPTISYILITQIYSFIGSKGKTKFVLKLLTIHDHAAAEIMLLIPAAKLSLLTGHL